MKRVDINLALYKSLIPVIISSDHLEVQNFFDEMNLDEVPDFEGEVFAHTVWGYCSIQQRPAYYIVLNPHNEKAKITPGIIGHECAHVIDLIWTKIGHEHSPDFPEPTNYLLEYLIDLVVKILYDVGYSIRASDNPAIGFALDGKNCRNCSSAVCTNDCGRR